MKRHAFVSIFALCMLLICTVCWGASTYYSQGNVEPNTTTNWNTVRNGGGVSPASFTTGDVFVVQNGHTMTTSGAWAISGSGSMLRIETGGSLIATSAITLAAGTTFQIDSGGVYKHQNASAYGSTIFQGTENFSNASTVELNASSTAGPSSVVFGNLIINFTTDPGGSVNCSGGMTAINGNLTVVTTGTKEFRLTGNSPLTLSVHGNLEIQGGTFNVSSGSSNTIINLTGDFSMSGGTLTESSTGSGTINFAKSGTQSFIKTGGSISNTINFIIKNGSALDLGGNIIDGSDGTFTLESGGELKIGSTAGITTSGATGNIQVTGARLFDSGAKYEYTGSAMQHSGNGLPSTVSNLMINNSNGVFMDGATTVSGTLAMINGSLSTGSNTLTLGSSSILSGEIAGRYVIGTCITTRTVGTSSSNFGGIGVDLGSGAENLGNITVQRITGSDALVPGRSVNISRRWIITTDVPLTYTNKLTNLDRTLTLSWISSDDNGSSFSASNKARTWRYNGITWQMFGSDQDVSNLTPRSVTHSAIDHIGEFTVSNTDVPLPVKLASFTASAKGRIVSLSWSAASEYENITFEIQRAVKNENLDWRAVGRVDGDLSHFQSRQYAYRDLTPGTGTYFYRMKMRDRHGDESFSELVKIDVALDQEDHWLGQNYPNPFNPITAIPFSVRSPQWITVAVYNGLGQLIRTVYHAKAEPGIAYSVLFDATMFSSGMYFYAIHSSQKTEVRSMIVLK